MNVSARFVLGDVERAGFEIPPEELREGLQPGDLAQLMLLSEGLEEAAWAEVTDVRAPGWFSGLLETGEPVEFGPEHVMDIQVPRTELGAEPQRRPGIFERAAEEMVRPRPPRGGPGVFERAAGPEMEPPPEARKGWSVFDLFRRRKAPMVELIPIPQTERRAEPPPSPEVQIFPTPEAPFVPPPPPGEPPPPAVIIPPAPPPEERRPGALIVPPAPAAPPAFPTAAAPFEILVPVAEAPLRAAPRGMIPVAEPPFEVLAPPGPPRGMTVITEPPFEVLEPPAAMLPTAAAPFEILVPPVEPRGVMPFEVLTPPPPAVIREAGPFEILVPTPEARALSPFEVLTPEAGLVPHGFAAMPGAMAPFEAAAPEVIAPVPAGEEAERAYIGTWAVPTPAEWLAFFRSFEGPRQYPSVEEIVEDMAGQRKDPYFRSSQIEESESGIPATIPIETSTDWTKIMKFLRIPKEVWKPYADRMRRDEEEDIMGDTWSKLEEDVFIPVSESIDAMFRRFRNLPGAFVLMQDGGTEGQTWGLVYYEGIDERQARKMGRELEEEERREGDLKSQRMKSRAWNPPEPKAYMKWIRDNFDLDALFADIRRERRSPEFKEEMRTAKKDHDTAEMRLQKIGEPKEGDRFLTEVASFLDIPDRVMSAYFGVRTGRGRVEDFNDEFNDEVLDPAMNSYNEAFDKLVPKDLPGSVRLLFGEDDEELWLVYLEDPRD